MVSLPSRIITVIPARGGSKRIPSKNLMPIGGLPLIAHSIRHALGSQHVSEVWVSTDDERIASVAMSHGAQVIKRPGDISGDTASSESALLHALDALKERGRADPGLLVFLQCTSPLRRVNDIDRAIETLVAQQADSLFSAREFNRLIWAQKDEEYYSLNYNFHKRQREQEMAEQWQENGSIYVLKPEILRQNNNRMGGRIALYEMEYWSGFQIDTPEDVELIEWLMQRPEYSPPSSLPQKIELIVFDFDGVMTDNTVLVDEHGNEQVRCNRGDGWGLARLREKGIPLFVLSTECHPVVSARCRKLHIEYHQGCSDKAAFLRQHMQAHNIEPSHVIYVGNDVNDLSCLQMVGCPVVVNDAHPDVKAVARRVLTQDGGKGAVRELCDLVLDHLQRVNLQSSS